MPVKFHFSKWLPVCLIWVGFVTSLSAGPQIQQWRTPNGVNVLYVPAPELPMVSLRVVFDAGSAREAKPGIANLTNALLEDGAGQWNADEIAERLESVGAEMGFGSERDMSWVTVRTLTEKRALTTAIDTLTTVLGEPLFETDDLERSRKAMQFILNRAEQSPSDVAGKAYYRAVFGDHPYAVDPSGEKVALATITREDLQQHYQRYYVANNATLAIVGAVEREEAERLAELITAKLAAGEAAPALPMVASLTAAQQVKIDFPSSQSHIRIGQVGMHRGDADYFTLYVGNHILGGGGLVSQLSEEVREKRGLSYSVYSYFAPMRRNGPFMIGAQTKNANAAEALEVIGSTLQHYIDNGPTEAELTAAKQNITGGFPLRIASNGKIIEYLTMLGFYGLPLDYLDTFVDKVNAITTAQIKDAFKRRIDPSKLVTVVVGNGHKEQASN